MRLVYTHIPMVLALLSLLTAASSPEVALLCSRPGTTTTELRFQPLGSNKVSEPVATFSHLESAGAFGTLLPKSHVVLAVAETTMSHASMWHSEMFRLEPGVKPLALVDRVAIGTRPLVVDGRVFLQRGRDGENGVDAITIDEVNPKTGVARTIHSYAGFWAFIAGAFEGEILVYRSGPERADLIAVHRDTMGVRTLINQMPALAHDFAVDANGRALYFTLGDQATGRWHVERVDLKTGDRSRVVEGDEVTLLPTVLPGSKLAFSPGPALGLRAAESDTVVLASHGPGFERVRSITRDGIAVGLHEIPSEFPLTFAVELKTGKALTVAAPPQHQLDVAGVVEP